jgi:hypothetical protein
LVGRSELIPEGADHSARLLPGRSEQNTEVPGALSRQMVLQVAVKDIGQLTDFETTAQRAPNLTVHSGFSGGQTAPDFGTGQPATRSW